MGIFFSLNFWTNAGLRRRIRFIEKNWLLENEINSQGVKYLCYENKYIEQSNESNKNAKRKEKVFEHYSKREKLVKSGTI